mgnify:FL=1
MRYSIGDKIKVCAHVILGVGLAVLLFAALKYNAFMILYFGGFSMVAVWLSLYGFGETLDANTQLRDDLQEIRRELAARKEIPGDDPRREFGFDPGRDMSSDPPAQE